MTDEAKNADRRKSSNTDLFRQRRLCARKRAMQFLFGLDLRKNWAFTADQLADFREMLCNLDEDTETLPAGETQKAMTYMETLVHGIAENITDIDGQIRAAARNWSLERMGPVDRCIIRVAVYEMAFVNGVTAPTAINEAVEMAKVFGQADTPRFVNGVLDRVRRMLETKKASENAESEPQNEN